MNLLSSIFKIIRKEHSHASRIQHTQNGRQRIDRCGLHPFASQRERAISDLRYIEVSAKEMLSQRSRDSDPGTSHPLRALTSLAKHEHFFLTKEQIESLGTCVSKRSGESAVYWSRSQNAYYKVKSPFAKQSLKSTSLSDCLFEHIIHARPCRHTLPHHRGRRLFRRHRAGRDNSRIPANENIFRKFLLLLPHQSTCPADKLNRNGESQPSEGCIELQ